MLTEKEQLPADKQQIRDLFAHLVIAENTCKILLNFVQEQKIPYPTTIFSVDCLIVMPTHYRWLNQNQYL